MWTTSEINHGRKLTGAHRQKSRVRQEFCNSQLKNPPNESQQANHRKKSQLTQTAMNSRPNGEKISSNKFTNDNESEEDAMKIIDEKEID